MGAFWYDFVVGNDWWVAVPVVVALGATFGLSRLVAAWWVLSVVVAMMLPWRLVRARRHR